jgi:hypothetical protein
MSENEQPTLSMIATQIGSLFALVLVLWFLTWCLIIAEADTIIDHIDHPRARSAPLSPESP